MVDLGTFALFRIKIGTVIIGVKWNDEFNAPYAHPVCIALHFYQHWMLIILIKQLFCVTWLIFQDISDEDDSETSDEDDDANFPMVWDCSIWSLILWLLFIFMIYCNCIINPFWHMQNAKVKNRATETPLMTTPSKGKNTGMKCYFWSFDC